MLFDLQSPRRRRAVRIIFGGLALVFAISFVAFGVGTGGSGFSLSDLFGGGGGSSGASAFSSDIKAAEERLQANPQDSAALADLVSLHYQAGNSEADSSGNLSTEGVQQMRESVDAWNRYVKASGGQSDRGPALIAVQAFSVLARVDFNEAARASSGSDQLQGLQAFQSDLVGVANAQNVVAQKQQTFRNYAGVAQYYYLAGKSQQAQQAVAKAKANAKGSEAKKLDAGLKQAQAQGAKLNQAIAQLLKQQSQGAGAGSAGGGANPLNGLGGGGGLGGTSGFGGSGP